ncbi:MAG: serine--glyoxylate aminotransferase [Rhodospirillaceae bacterium]|nr:serine--glyoxylate aminotransferase [Rhodospirillaceae bacterium]|tara:strand:- start:964 stop:2136 length:1173 start_codon:yes stop_codon:yes gene_type:complete
MTTRYGRQFLQIPGPSNVPDRVLRAIDQPTIDHRGPDFKEFTWGLLERVKKVFKCEDHVIIYPSSGSGAWEAALVNTLSPGDTILMVETGEFAVLWRDIAIRFGLNVDFVPGDWRHGVDPQIIEEKLKTDESQSIKAVAVVQNETSTGVTSDIFKVRQAIDAANHSALLLVDVISSLGSVDYRHSEWGVDVTIGGSQKGLMLPPGLGFNAINQKAIKASADAKLPKSYWNWSPILESNSNGFFPYTPATNLLFGLDEALNMLFEEGLDNAFARHARLAEATRRAVDTWGLENLAINPSEYSNVLTAVLLPEGHDADGLRQIILENFDMPLGTGLGKVKGKVFRIGHLGWFNELMLAGTLSGVEMGLSLSDIPFNAGGVQAALNYLIKNSG